MVVKISSNPNCEDPDLHLESFVVDEPGSTARSAVFFFNPFLRVSQQSKCSVLAVAVMLPRLFPPRTPSSTRKRNFGRPFFLTPSAGGVPNEY
eukprot:1524053-Rhodomonas_salina.1